MNRLKVWVFALLAVAAAAFLLRLHSDALRAEALAQLDARLAAGAAHARAALRGAERDAAVLAALAARDADLVRALAPAAAPEAPPVRRRGAPPPAPPDPGAGDAAADRAASAALASAAQGAGLPALPEGTLVAAGDRRALERRVAAGPLAPAWLHLQAALDGAARSGFVRAGPTLHAAGAAPAPGGAAVAVLVPIADAFARDLAAATRLDVALAAPEARVVATGRPTEAPGAIEAARSARGTPAGVGALGPVDVSVPPLALRGLPPLFGAPAHRVLAVPLAGVEGGLLVLSAPTAPALAPIAVFEWHALAALALLLVLGLLFGLLVRPSEILPAVPEELVAAAARIERGEFDARAPQLAGKLGTVADALNRAAAAASAPPAPAPLPPDPFAAASAPPPAVEPSAFEFAPRPRAEPPPAVEARADGAPLLGGAFEAAPVPARAEPEPDRFGRPERFAAPAAAPAPAPLDAPAEAAPAATADPATDEEGHWREIFQDFLRVRAECGEPAQGLPYDRFRQKLQANKATLVAKYGCRTVRFQVYVKDGKTALKATPVR
jgi:hypothetical protein